MVLWVTVSLSDDLVAFVAYKLFLLNPALHVFMLLLGHTSLKITCSDVLLGLHTVLVGNPPCCSPGRLKRQMKAGASNSNQK